MRQYLLPVWGHSRFMAAARDFGLRTDKSGNVVGWWDEPPFNFGHVLISYVHWKKAFKFPDGCYVFGDSGGFSLRSETMADKLRIDPVGVLQWQESLCTVGCVLDLPPTGRRRIWHKGMRVTVDHTRRALPEYQKMLKAGTKFRWWGVLHGNNEAEVREYYEALSEVYPFELDGEGWAIRAEPQVNIYAVARSLRILKSLGIKRVHFLAATSQDVTAVLLALGPQAGIEVMTYDSAYAVKSGFNRHVFRPNDDGLTWRIQTEQGLERAGRDWLLHECPCAVCDYMRKRTEDTERGREQVNLPEFGGWWSTWLQFHDLHIQQQLTTAQAAFAERNPEALLRAVLNPREYSSVMRIFEEDGHEPKMIAQTGSARSLLDFLK